MPPFETLSSWASKCLKISGEFRRFFTQLEGLERPATLPEGAPPSLPTLLCLYSTLLCLYSMHHHGCQTRLFVLWLPHWKVSSPRVGLSLCSLLRPQHIEKDLTHWLDEQGMWKEYFDQRLTSPSATEICWPRSEGRKETPGGGVSAPSSQDSAAAGVSKRLGDTAAWHPAEWTTSPRCGTERAEATRPESTWARAMVASQR